MRPRRPVPDLHWFERAFGKLADRLPHPAPGHFRGMTAYRFQTRTLEAAVILKLARYVSGLHAGHLLAENGYFQELASLQRSLDEMHEDILFLSLPSFGLEETADHASYFQAFWEEEPEFSDFKAHQKGRWSIPRKKIRAYLAKVNAGDTTDHTAIAVSAYLSRMYSGYVHGAAPQLLELYDPRNQRYRVSGYPESPFGPDHFNDFEYQFFRGVFALFVVARLVGNAELAAEAFEIHNRLAPLFSD